MSLLTTFKFKVEITALDIDLQASEVSGLSVSIDTETVKEGGNNEFVQKLPGYPQHTNLVIKRAMGADATFLKWLNASLTTYLFTPVDMTISMINEQQQPVVSWNVAGAYPVKWEAPTLQSDQSNLAIETLEFAYQQFNLI